MLTDLSIGLPRTVPSLSLSPLSRSNSRNSFEASSGKRPRSWVLKSTVKSVDGVKIGETVREIGLGRKCFALDWEMHMFRKSIEIATIIKSAVMQAIYKIPSHYTVPSRQLRRAKNAAHYKTRYYGSEPATGRRAPVQGV